MSNDILVKVGADVSDYSRKMKESANELAKFSQANMKTFDAFKKTGMVISAAGATLTAGLGFAVNKAKDFETGMSSVAAISGATGDDFEALSKRARELGGSTSFSALEAAEGLEYLALAGWDTAQMIDGLEPVLHLAEAGALDLGRTSDLVTDSMAGLGLEVSDLGGYLDKVAQTAANSNTDIDALMDAFVIAGGTFERLNIPLEESTTFLGLLANRGFKASEAGTAINAIMSRLTSGTGEAADALDELGISAFDSEGNFKGMEAVMRELESALVEMDDETRSHYQTMLAGLNHGKTFNAMINGLGNEYDDLKASIVDSDGALLNMRNTMKDNLQGALENLSSAFEEILISLGTALLPVVKTLVDWLQNLADWFNGLSDNTKTTIALIAGATAVFLTTVGSLSLLIGLIPNVIKMFSAMTTAVSKSSKFILGAASAMKTFATSSTLATTVQGVLTGRLNLSTAAMIAKSAAAKTLGTVLKVMSGPVGWITAGAGLLAGAVVGVVKWFNRETEEAKRLNAETEKLADATGGLTDTVASSADAYKEKQSSTEADIRNNEELARKVQELADKESLSAAEKEMLRSYTDELNESMGDLNLAYDEEAGKLNLSSEEIQARIDLLGEQEKANDAMERAKEITEEQVLAEEKLAEASALREEWNEKLEEGSVKSKEHKKALEELDEQEKELQDTLDDLSDQYEETEQQVENSMNAIAQASKDATEGQLLDYETLSDEQKNLVDRMTSKWQELADASTDIFNKISTDAETSFEEMQETFNHNVKATEEWASNLEKLAEAGVSSAFLDTFREMGPQSAAHVKELVDADIKEVIKLGEGFEEQTEKALDQMARAYNLDTKQFEAVRHLVQDVGMTFEEAINSAGFDQYGEDIADGVDEGVVNGTDKVVGAVEYMSGAMGEAFREINGIHSPSRVYKEFGQFIGDGLNIGIKDKAKAVTAAVKSLSLSMISAFSGVSAKFNSIGRNAMSGLNAGLNAGRPAVLANARGIANNIASTMQQALKIHSPSRIMRDDIGRWIPAGIADGIEGNAKTVYDAIQSLSGGISSQDLSLDYATPNGIFSNLPSAISGTVDVNERDGLLAGAINQLERRLDGMQVVMDGETVGVLTAPTVSREIQADSDREYRRTGGRSIR